MNEHAVIAAAVDLFKCDDASVIVFDHTPRKYLLLHWNRRNDRRWYRVFDDGTEERFNFDYVERKVVANGETWESLWESAMKYKRLLDIGNNPEKVIEYLKECANA